MFLLIFASPRRRNSPCIQKREGLPVAHSLCAISFVWAMRMVRAAAVNVERRTHFIAIAEHSMPAGDDPTGLSHSSEALFVPSGLNFQSAKSAAACFSPMSMREPCGGFPPSRGEVRIAGNFEAVAQQMPSEVR